MKMDSICTRFYI